MKQLLRRFSAPLVPCDTTPHGDPWELFAKQTFRTTAMAVVCGDLLPAVILKKGNARCALAKTLTKRTKALAWVYSLPAALVRRRILLAEPAKQEIWPCGIDKRGEMC